MITQVPPTWTATVPSYSNRWLHFRGSGDSLTSNQWLR